jgi:flagellar biosynthesis/type III secretory pathway chaperone
LIGILAEEQTVLEELIVLAGETRDAAYKKDRERLDAVVRREQGAVMRLEHWEKQRLACLSTLEDQPGSVTLLFFADLAPRDEGEELRKAYETLSGLIDRLRKLNNENRVLIESRLEYVQFVLDTLGGEQSSGVYGAGGVSQSTGSVPKKILDKKV